MRAPCSAETSPSRIQLWISVASRVGKRSATSARLVGALPAPAQFRERRAGQARKNPLAAKARAQPPVEADGRPVPVEHRPLEAAAAAPHRDARERGEERASRALSALFGQHEEVLEIEGRLGEEGGEREEVEREAHGTSTPARDERLEVGAPAEAVTAHARRGGPALVTEPLVIGKAPDEGEDGGNVTRRARADRQRAARRTAPGAPRLPRRPHRAPQRWLQ